MTENPLAFPVKTWERKSSDPLATPKEVYHPGMTLRDWFAGQVLAGLCASIQRGPTGYAEVDGDGFVRDSYTLADAMLKQRERQP